MVSKRAFLFWLFDRLRRSNRREVQKVFLSHTQMALNCKELTAPCKPLAETVYLRLGVKSEPRIVKSNANKGRHEQAQVGRD